MGQALPWTKCLPFRAPGRFRPSSSDQLGPFSGRMRTSDPAPEGKVSARLRSPPHIPVPADAIATRSHLPLLTVLLAMPFVVFPPPSHKLHLGSPRGGDGTRSLRERADRRTGTSRPSSARRLPRVQKPVAKFGNKDGPLSRHTKQTIPTYRTRGPRREATPTPLPKLSLIHI